MKRVAVFAHYDKNDKIQDFVIFYLNKLRQHVEKIVFVSDCNLQETEINKISPFVYKVIAKRHGEYDFGSYKRGFAYILESGLLKDCEELIFANDSCYAPLYPFEEVFNKMSVQNLDFWGITMNPVGIEVRDGKIHKNQISHIQSYFIAFKSTVFNSEVFLDFMKNIKREKTKEEIIEKYEVNLTNTLFAYGFVYNVYCETSKNNANSHVYFYKTLIKEDRSPFLKRSITLLKEIRNVCPFFISSFIKRYTEYDYKLIMSDCAINREYFALIKNIGYLLKKLRRWFIRIHLKESEIYFLGVRYGFKD